ncbi:PaaI family thioesterase [Hymenobacter sp. UYP22]|uniref:PaaI family thioesterase n=1 Tax=Hymenobacter sp. UYP22 TaxID=3156348 RepID=UPI003397484B
MTSRTRTFSWHDPLVGAQAARNLSGSDYLAAMSRGEYPLPPLMHTLGFDHLPPTVEPGKVTFYLEPQEYHYNPIGSVHGGVFAALLDSAMGCAVHTTLPAGVGYTTLELKVNFVRPLTATTGLVSCEGLVLSSGRQVATAEGRITDAAGKLYAHATTTCLLLRP